MAAESKEKQLAEDKETAEICKFLSNISHPFYSVDQLCQIFVDI